MLLKSQKWSHCAPYVRRAESSRHLWEKLSKPFSLTQINKREGTWRPYRYLICHQKKCYLGWLSGPLQIQIYFLAMRSLDSESLWEEYIWASKPISWYHGNTSKSLRRKLLSGNPTSLNSADTTHHRRQGASNSSLPARSKEIVTTKTQRCTLSCQRSAMWEGHTCFFLCKPRAVGVQAPHRTAQQTAAECPCTSCQQEEGCNPPPCTETLPYLPHSSRTLEAFSPVSLHWQRQSRMHACRRLWIMDHRHWSFLLLPTRIRVVHAQLRCKYLDLAKVSVQRSFIAQKKRRAVK